MASRPQCAQVQTEAKSQEKPFCVLRVTSLVATTLFRKCRSCTFMFNAVGDAVLK